MIRFLKLATFTLLSVLAGWLTVGALAEEQPRKFLQTLRERGYGDMAVEYLKLMTQQPPGEVADVWDLEMARSLLAAAVIEPENYDRLVEQAQEHLKKFLREHEAHPEAPAALNELAGLLVNEALHRIKSAKFASEDSSRRQALFTEAREYLTQARRQLEQSHSKLQTRLASMPQASTPPAKQPRRPETDARAEIEAALQETRLRLALLDYYLAQTYEKAEKTAREELLHRAAAAFDDVFQRDRQSGGLSFTGLYAHLWHGKAAEELGNLQLAMDIYDEVLAAAPEPNQRGADLELEPLFTQVEYFRLSLLARQKPEVFLAEAEAWLKQYRRLRKTEGYQGVILEVARALQTQAARLQGTEKNRRLSEALQVLSEATRTRSSFQHEAVLLRRELLTALGRDANGTTSFEEALSLAEAAALSGRWIEACNAYQKAVDLARQTGGVEESRLAAAQEALAGAKLMLAKGLFNQGKYDACLSKVEAVIFEDQEKKIVRRQSTGAVQAAALAVAATLQLYASAKKDQKPAALQQLLQAVELVETHWPNRPEADDARLACAQAKISAGQYLEAAEVLERIQPNSERYLAAMYQAAQCHARLYLLEKAKPAEKREPGRLEAERMAAIKRLQKALNALASQSDSAELPPKYRFDAQLLLAELYAEGSENERAASVYQTLLASFKTEKPAAYDAGVLRMFLGAVRTYCLLGRIDEAAVAANLLLDSGLDESGVNAVLLECAKLLETERKQALAGVVELEKTPDQQALQAAQTRLYKAEKLSADFLLRLAERKAVSPQGRMFIADGLNAAGQTAEAAGQYQRLLELAGSRTDVLPPLVTRARAQLIGLLRKQGNYAEALQQAEQLIKENPHALEPLMERGRILQAWAEKEPARRPAALNHWIMLRNKLQNLNRKPPEYFEAVYNTALCLVREAELSGEATTAKDRARQAEQVLKAVLVLHPQLSSPDMVAQYKQLLEKAQELQQRLEPQAKPLTKGPKP